MNRTTMNPKYLAAVARMEARSVAAEIAELKSRMRRMRPDLGGAEKQAYNADFADLMALEKDRRTLEAQAQAYDEADLYRTGYEAGRAAALAEALPGGAS